MHEPEATELQPDVVLRDLFDQGLMVGERARLDWPGGILIEGDHRDRSRVGRTRAAIEAGADVLFEACFEEDDVFCAVDVLERGATGWTLIEVKSSTGVKDVHLPDVAVQTHVVRRAGLPVTRMEVMHLNGDFRAPDVGPRFTRTDVTAKVEAMLPEVPARIAEQVAVLRGALPAHAVGSHCWNGADACAFFDRCWPADPDHIRHLWNVGGKRTIGWMQQGVTRMGELPATARLNPKQRRQLTAQRENRLIVERELTRDIVPAVEARHLGFLDFETVARAIPSWNGLGPWRQTAAQFSYHERDADGGVTHAEFLAEGPADPSNPPDDPREAIARAMLAASANADRVVVYTHFEGTQIKQLADQLPHLSRDLMALHARLWDIKPVISENVYHPDFRGSFSLKDITGPLTGLTYDDLVIVDGMVASAEIARLLFVSGRIPPTERDRIRRDLLDYCERDTFATVRLVERLIALATH